MKIIKCESLTIQKYTVCISLFLPIAQLWHFWIKAKFEIFSRLTVQIILAINCHCITLLHHLQRKFNQRGKQSVWLVYETKRENNREIRKRKTSYRLLFDNCHNQIVCIVQNISRKKNNNQHWNMMWNREITHEFMFYTRKMIWHLPTNVAILKDIFILKPQKKIKLKRHSILMKHLA